MKIKAVRGLGRERILYKVTRGFFKKVIFSRLLIIQHALIFRELWVEGQVLVVQHYQVLVQEGRNPRAHVAIFFPPLKMRRCTSHREPYVRAQAKK